MGILPFYFEIMGLKLLWVSQYIFNVFFLLVRIWRNALSKHAKPYNSSHKKRCKITPQNERPTKLEQDVQCFSKCTAMDGWCMH
jgi:hypothetical protein